MRLKIRSLLLVCTALLSCATLNAQDEKKGTESPANITVHIRDYCDPLTFGNLCTRSDTSSGAITFPGFLAELGADKSVGAWRFAPDKAKAEDGAMLSLKNLGGETHTFTRVKKFGGGFVSFLNGPSGNPTPAPECAQMVNGQLVPAAGVQFIPAGGTAQVSVPEGEDANFQCCIHPWMRMTVKADEHNHEHHD